MKTWGRPGRIKHPKHRQEAVGRSWRTTPLASLAALFLTCLAIVALGAKLPTSSMWFEAIRGRYDALVTREARRFPPRTPICFLRHRHRDDSYLGSAGFVPWDTYIVFNGGATPEGKADVADLIARAAALGACPSVQGPVTGKHLTGPYYYAEIASRRGVS